MPLSGHSSDLSLADLVQANIFGRNTCRVIVGTSEGQGVFYIADGAIVDATYGDLVGVDAFTALVTTDSADFRVDSGLRSPARTINASWQGLLIDAMRMRDENKVPKPHRIVPAPAPLASVPQPPSPPPATQAAPSAQAVASAQLARAQTEPPREEAQLAPDPTSPGPKRSGLRLLVAVPALLAVLGVGGYLALGRHTGEAQGAATPASPASIQTVEASELQQAGDTQPRLSSGPPPISPNNSLAVAPTVVCRILVDQEGKVVEARIFRSRLELAAFEDAALEAIKAYRFTPGTRAGQPVRVWINWPVSFQ